MFLCKKAILVFFLLFATVSFAQETPLKQVTLSLIPIGCCVGSAKTALDELEGIQKKQLEFGKAIVIYDPQKVTPDQMIQALSRQFLIAVVAVKPQNYKTTL